MKGRCPKRLFGVTKDINNTLAIYFYSLLNMYTKPLSVKNIYRSNFETKYQGIKSVQVDRERENNEGIIK